MNLTIRIYEWPLSSNSIIAKATVFELKIPQSFSDWRDVSRHMVTTIFFHEDKAVQRLNYCATLDRHTDLSHMLSSKYSSRCIVLASSVKAHTVTHRKSQKAVPFLNEGDVCLQNALRYSYYDNSQASLSNSKLHCTQQVAKDCTYKMPPRSKKLECFMFKTASTPNGLPPNEVIANLADCPSSLFY